MLRLAGLAGHASGPARLPPGLPAMPSLPSLPSLQSGDSFLGVLTPYRMDIVQGNVVTKEQVAQVKPGMTRNQVRDILGSPMLTDLFHADRWDYVFTIRRQGTAPQRRDVVAFFKGDKLERTGSQGPAERARVRGRSAAPLSSPGCQASRCWSSPTSRTKALPKPACGRTRADACRWARCAATRRWNRHERDLAPLRIAIAGASGRMGRMLVEAVLAAPDLQLAGALDVPAARRWARMPARLPAATPAWPSPATCAPAWPTPRC